MARNENFNSRWGDSELDDTGYITVPGWIMRNYHRYTDPDGNVVGITPHEFTFMCHVMSFKYDVAGSKAKPSLQTVARLMGRHITNVRNIKNGMAKKAALTVTEIPGAPNVYDFGNLVRQCRRYEFERSGEITTPSEIAGGTPSEIASPPLVKPLAKEVEVIKKTKGSAPNGAGSTEKPKAPRKQDPIYNAVRLHIFGIDDENAESTRIAMIAHWLNGKNDGPKTYKVGYITKPAEAKHVEAFVKWWKREYDDAPPPRHFEKFVDNWRQWASSATKPAAKPHTMSPAAAEPDDAAYLTPAQFKAMKEAQQ